MPPRVLFLDPEFLILVGVIHAIAGVVSYVALTNAKEEGTDVQVLPEGALLPAAPGPLGRFFPAINIRQRRRAV